MTLISSLTSAVKRSGSSSGRRQQGNSKVQSNERDKALSRRIDQLVKQADIPSPGYAAITRQFERLAQGNDWVNADGSIYPVALVNLQKYIAFNEGRIKPQSILSYLSAIRDKHEQLGFFGMGECSAPRND